MKPVICIIGPSGVGKNFYIKLLIQKFNLERPKIITSRKPRRDDENHIYVSKNDFTSIIQNNSLLEWDEYNGNFYGIMLDEFKDLLNDDGNNGVIMDITSDGCRQIKRVYSEAIAIALVPDDISWLKERLIKRGTNEKEEIEKRMEISKKDLKKIHEIADFTILCKNDFKNTNEILEEISEIIRKIKKYP